MIEVHEMVAAWLRATGCDGLYRDSGCWCSLDDLAPCGVMQHNCQAARKHILTQGDIDLGRFDYDETPSVGDWTMVPIREPAAHLPIQRGGEIKDDG